MRVLVKETYFPSHKTNRGRFYDKKLPGCTVSATLSRPKGYCTMCIGTCTHISTAYIYGKNVPVLIQVKQYCTLK